MLSNFGTLAGRYATPVVVPPAVAILGAGRLSQDVVAVAGGFAAHPRMPLSLTFDHRCVTGAEAARFLARSSTISNEETDMHAQVSEQGSEGLHGIPQARLDLIESIVAAAPRRATNVPAVVRKRFLRQYFLGVGEEDLAQRQAGNLAAVALRHLEMGSRARAVGEARVEVFNLIQRATASIRPTPSSSWLRTTCRSWWTRSTRCSTRPKWPCISSCTRCSPCGAMAVAACRA